MPRKPSTSAPAEELPALDLDGGRALIASELDVARREAQADPYVWGNRLARLERLAALLDGLGGEVHLPAVAAMRRR